MLVILCMLDRSACFRFSVDACARAPSCGCRARSRPWRKNRSPTSLGMQAWPALWSVGMDALNSRDVRVVIVLLYCTFQ